MRSTELNNLKTPKSEKNRAVEIHKRSAAARALTTFTKLDFEAL